MQNQMQSASSVLPMGEIWNNLLGQAQLLSTVKFNFDFVSGSGVKSLTTGRLN